jgi:hypothetical protein
MDLPLKPTGRPALAASAAAAPICPPVALRVIRRRDEPHRLGRAEPLNRRIGANRDP